MDAVTATKSRADLRVEHTGQTPGVRATYHIKAHRRAVLSDPSNEAVIYG